MQQRSQVSQLNGRLADTCGIKWGEDAGSDRSLTRLSPHFSRFLGDL